MTGRKRREPLTATQRRWRRTARFYGSPATRWIVPTTRRILYGAQDLRDALVGRSRPSFVPPKRMAFVGGDFEPVGQSFLGLFRGLGGLDAKTDVLDIGSGIGRMAVPMLDVLDPDSRYEGFDVVAEGVEWCAQTITPRHPNFRFRHVDLRNDRYNPSGAERAEDFRFPYDDASFDLAIATSVFTHLPPAAAANYVAEAARVLRPGGRLLGTWYLLGGERPRGERPEGDELAWFPVALERCRVVSARVPEFAIALDEEDVLAMHRSSGLEPTTHHGRWLGADGPSFQDIVVAVRPASAE